MTDLMSRPDLSECPVGYWVDKHANGAWAWHRIDNVEGDVTWQEFDTEPQAVAGAWRDSGEEPPTPDGLGKA